MRKAVAVAVLASVVALGCVSAAVAEPTITRLVISSEVSFVVDDTCFGTGVTGTFTGTDTLTLQRVETPSTQSTFQVQGTDTLVYRIDFSNGAYIVGSNTAHFTFTDVGGGSVTINPFNLHDIATIYGADGTRLGITQFHVAEQLTFANGTVQVNFEKIHAMCP